MLETQLFSKMLALLRQTLSDACVSKSTRNNWYMMLEESRESVELRGGLGVPPSSVTKQNIYTGGTVIQEDTRLATQQLRVMFGKSF